MPTHRFDFIVVGSGIAGLTYALKVAQHGTVAIITKKDTAESNTNYAQGGIACVTSDEDSFELHVQDTLKAGAGLCDEAIARQIIAEGPARIQELIDLAVPFSERELEGKRELDLGKEGGHTKRRILHVGDITGRAVEESLIRSVQGHPNINVFENHYAVDLITTHKLGHSGENQCLGLYALNQTTKEVSTFASNLVVLATGGCGKCYLYTTNPSIATGDGVAIAYRAGVAVANMEFIQFHPTCLYHPLNRSFLITEALRGEGARLINAQGEDIMQRAHSMGNLATRDIVARAIDAEMKSSGASCVYLDITFKPREFLQKRFPNIYQTCQSLGIDIASQPIPVVPAAHYQCGGVQVNINGATSLQGLYAIGEVACTGLHGANRLASNSLLEALVTAHRSAQHSIQNISHQSSAQPLPDWQEGNAHDADELVVVTHNWKEIRQLMWDYVGIVRTTKRLQRARKRLQMLMDEVQEFYWDFKLTGDLIELRNLTLVSQLIVESALQRKESRGLHYTSDYPETSTEIQNTVLKR